MPATKKPPVKPPATDAARARCEENGRTINRIADSLDVAQRDLKAISGTLGSGASDLRKDVSKLLRDARRDVTKMSKSVRRDLERLQRDLGSTSGAKGKRGTGSRASGTSS